MSNPTLSVFAWNCPKLRKLKHKWKVQIYNSHLISSIPLRIFLTFSLFSIFSSKNNSSLYILKRIFHIRTSPILIVLFLSFTQKGKFFPNHTHVDLSFSLAIFILFFWFWFFIAAGLRIHLTFLKKLTKFKICLKKLN